MSDSTKEKIKARDAAQLTASTTQLKEDWDNYKRLRNDPSVVKKREKPVWQQQKLVKRVVTMGNSVKTS